VLGLDSDSLKADNFTMRNIDEYLLTAGGRIRCLRCTANSTRTKKQCGKPALKNSTTQKCQIHGGRPHTPEVLRRISEANTIHGESTKAAKEQFRKDAVLIRQLEDAVHVLKMGEGPRMRGRKPNGYCGVYSQEDVVRMMRERAEQRN
jgi:hypothetical protein